MAVRRSRFSQPRTPRMNRYWTVFIDIATLRLDVPLDIITNAEVAGTVLFKNAVSLPLTEDVTVARMFMPYVLDVPVTTRANICVGTAIVSPGATTSLVNAVTDADWDGWFMHQYLELKGDMIGSIDKDVDQASTRTKMSGTLDIKSKRKVPQGSILLVSYAVEFTETAPAADDMAFSFGLRALLMEK